MIVTIKASTNSSGAASVTTTNTFTGYVYGVRVVLTGTHPGTNITLSETNAMGRSILSLGSITTSAQYNPTNAAQTTAGATVTNGYTPFYLNSTNLTLVVASAPVSTTDAVVVYVNLRSV